VVEAEVLDQLVVMELLEAVEVVAAGAAQG
jgi:hypothetical protein